MYQLYLGGLGRQIGQNAANCINIASSNAKQEIAASAKALRVAALKAAHPDLISPDRNVDSLIAAAKNLRTQLKADFPGVKFRVTTTRFSMGDSLRVAWTDGPASDRVEEIIGAYKEGHFDGMTDSYEYSNSDWTEAFGSAKYVSGSRDYSLELTAWANQPTGWENQRARWQVLQHLNIKAVKTPEAN